MLFRSHSKPLYITTQINDVHIRRALVNTGASLNLIPTSTLKAVGIPLSRIAEAPIEVLVLLEFMNALLGVYN